MTYALHTDQDGVFLLDEDGVLLPLVPKAAEVLQAIHRRTTDATASGVRESDLREILRDIRNMTHEVLK